MAKNKNSVWHITIEVTTPLVVNSTDLQTLCKSSINEGANRLLQSNPLSDARVTGILKVQHVGDRP